MRGCSDIGWLDSFTLLTSSLTEHVKSSPAATLISIRALAIPVSFAAEALSCLLVERGRRPRAWWQLVLLTVCTSIA